MQKSRLVVAQAAACFALGAACIPATNPFDSQAPDQLRAPARIVG